MPFLTTSVIGFFLIGFGNGPLFPNLNYLTPENFGENISQNLMGIQMAASYLGIMLAPAVFGILGQWIGVWLLPLFLICFYFVMLASHSRQNIFFSQIPSTYPILYGQLNKTNQKPLSDGTNLLDRGIFVVILCNIVPAHSKVHNTCRFRLLPVRRVCLAGSQHPRGIQRFHRRICKRTDGERYR